MMKWISRYGRITLYCLVSVSMTAIGCGDETYPEEGPVFPEAEAQTNEHSQTLNRLPRESLRPLPMVDEKGYPIDPHLKNREVRLIENPSAYEDSENDPRFVRETGFPR